MQAEVDSFSHIRAWFARQGGGELCALRDLRVCAFESGNRSSPRPAAPGKRAEVSAASFVAARLVNLQECRIKRDPLFTDRSSTKPCGRCQNGTRTCLPSAPAPMDLYGMGFFYLFIYFAEHLCGALHNDRTAST